MTTSAKSAAPVYATTVIAAVLTFPAVYAALRGYDALFKHEANPATVIWSARIAMFWRLGIGGYAAGMVVPLAYLSARANLEKTVRVVTVAAGVVAAMITVQGLLLP